MEIDISKLKFHPSSKIFGDLPLVEFENLKDDIKERGLQQPIEITKDFTIICGTQRIKAYKELKLKKIEARIRNDLSSKEKIKEHLIKDNILRRQLNPVQIAQAGEELEKIYKPKARERELAGKKTYPRENLPKGEEKGRIRDQVAKIFNISGKTYETYKKAVKIATPKEVEFLKIKKLKPSQIISSHQPKKKEDKKIIQCPIPLKLYNRLVSISEKENILFKYLMIKIFREWLKWKKL